MPAPESIPVREPRWRRPKRALEERPVCGMTKLYEWIAEGRVHTKKVDGIRLVDLNSLDDIANE